MVCGRGACSWSGFSFLGCKHIELFVQRVSDPITKYLAWIIIGIAATAFPISLVPPVIIIETVSKVTILFVSNGDDA